MKRQQRYRISIPRSNNKKHIVLTRSLLPICGKPVSTCRARVEDREYTIRPLYEKIKTRGDVCQSCLITARARIARIKGD